MQPADFLRLPVNWRRQWWFFNPENANLTTNAAFKWELVRRSDAYWQIWRAISPLTISPELRNAANRPGPNHSKALRWLLAAEQSAVVRMAFYYHCPVGSHWIDLSPKQRTAVEDRMLLPELDPPQAVGDVIVIAMAQITEDVQNRNRRVRLLWPPDAGLKNLGIAESEVFRNVPNGKWIVVFFDANLPYERLARQFDEVAVGPSVLNIVAKCESKRIPRFEAQIEQKLRELGKTPLGWPQALWAEMMRLYKGALHPAEWLQCQVGCADKPNLRDLRKQTHVVPTLYDPRSACLIPPICDAAEVRKLFRFLVHRGHRKSWLPGCEQFWNMQIAKRGLDPLPQLKLVKSGQSKYRWIALAAHDLESLHMADPATRFLCARWLALTRSKRANGQRLAYNELHNLRDEISHLLAHLHNSTWFPGKSSAQ